MGVRHKINKWVMKRMIAVLGRDPRLSTAADVEFSGYYVPTHTWTTTPGEPTLSTAEAYRAAEDIKTAFPPSTGAAAQ